ncbi:MAG: hypothetical protein SVU24_07615, partial [Pseudomonadota bacterium]|nr:hypothetical protein [Pseudomonadota bacterium]
MNRLLRSQPLGNITGFVLEIQHHAIFIGFTGTPLLRKDKQTTREVFGRYIHTYKFPQAVADGV